MFSQWQLKDYDAGAGIAAQVFADNIDPDGWIDVEVPGDVHLALMAAGRLPDPFEDRNERLCGWVEDREWWYRSTFLAARPAPGERLSLIFHGLDTFATIWLNGARLGQSDNMFLPAAFDIGAMVRPGQTNTLAICFEAVALRLAAKSGPTWIGMETIGKTKRNLVRKAQFGWGWDWGPRLPTVGVWRPVELRLERRAAIADIHVSTLEIDADTGARLAIRVDVTRIDGAARPDLAVTMVDAAGHAVLSVLLPVPPGEGSHLVEIERAVLAPELWWTHDLGMPYLYTLHVELIEGGTALDRQTKKVGIRTIDLDRSPDAGEPGTELFRFMLNGVPIFARGACWIPVSSFVGAIGDAQYRPLLDAAVDTHMNMIRVWGGGIYEHDSFYDLCDEAGLLVWQDFMFACAPYPEDDPAFVESIRREVRYQVRRLRGHPSLALWCGNNENQVIQTAINAVTRRSEPLAGSLYYDEIMPTEVGELDPTTPYWPGSPYGGIHPNSQDAGDVHDWTVWHGFPPIVAGKPVGGLDRSPPGVAYARYAEDFARFVSEFGIQASPAMETLRRCMPEDQLFLGSPSLDHRIKDEPKNKVDMMMATVTGLPQTLSDYVDYTMMTQAEGLKFGIEHFRRRKPHCSGALIWQLNDCWPGISWSIVDYNGFGKAAYFYVKRAYAAVIASFKPMEDGSIELWVVNDRLDGIDDSAMLDLGDFATGPVWSEVCGFRVPANSSRCVWRGTADRVAAAPNLYLRVRSSSGHFPTNRHFFAPIKDLSRPRGARPQVAVEQVGRHELSVELRATSYLHFVHILAVDERTRFSDNYFDLVPGEVRRISVFNAAGDLSRAKIEVGSR